MRGLLLTGEDGGFQLVSVKVKADINYLVASSIVTLCYENKENKPQYPKFQWVGGYPLPHFQNVSILNNSKTLELESSILANMITENLVSPDDQSKSPLPKTGLHCPTIDVGEVPAQSHITITLAFVDQLSVHRYVKSSDSAHQARLVYTLPASITSLNEPQELGEQKNFGKIQQKKCQFIFQSNLKMPSQMSKISTTYNQYNQTFLSRDQRGAQCHITCDFQPEEAMQLEIILKEPPRLFGHIEYLSKKSPSPLTKDCLSLTFHPDFSTCNGNIETKTELILVIDRSRLVTEIIMEQFGEAMLLFLKGIPDDCLFQIIGFGTRCETLFTMESSEKNSAAINRALRYHKGLRNDMGSNNLYSALEYALTSTPSQPGWHKQILVLLAGGLEHVAQVSNLMASHRHKAKIFFIGVGPLITENMLRTISQSGQADFEHLPDPAPLCRTFLKMLNRALQPRATNLQLKFTSRKYDPSTTLIIPRQLPVVNWGEAVHIFILFPEGGFNSLKGGIELTYTIGEQTEIAKLDLKNVQIFARGNNVVASPLSQFANQYFLHDQIGQCENGITGIEKRRTWKCIQWEDEENVNPEEIITTDARPTVHHAPSQSKSNKNTLAKPPKNRRTNFQCCGTGRPKNTETINSDISKHPATSDETANVLQLAKLQTFDGFWPMDQNVCDCLSIRMEQADSMIPKIPIPESRTIWATALVLSYLQANRIHQSDTWSLLWYKGTAWLNQQYPTGTASEQPVDMSKDEYLMNAKSALYACKLSRD